MRTVDHLTRKLGHQFPAIFKTITMDNGSEFYKSKQRTTIFYCHPYASYERGSNENANKLIRRHIPKGHSMAKISRTKAKEIQHWINHDPRPMFKGKCSNDIFFEAPRQEGISITPALLDLFP